MKDSSRQLTYEGKDVFIGIDVHKRTYSVVSVVEGEIVKKWQTSAVPKKLAEQLMSYFPKANKQECLRGGVFGICPPPRTGKGGHREPSRQPKQCRGSRS